MNAFANNVLLGQFLACHGHFRYGDSTALLRALVEAGVKDGAMGCMCDPDVAAWLHTVGVGKRVSLSLGGKTDPAYGGPPLRVQVRPS